MCDDGSTANVVEGDVLISSTDSSLSDDFQKFKLSGDRFKYYYKKSFPKKLSFYLFAISSILEKNKDNLRFAQKLIEVK